MFIMYMFSHPDSYWLWTGVCLLSIFAHELGHVITARFIGVEHNLKIGAISLPFKTGISAPSIAACFFFGVAWGASGPQTPLLQESPSKTSFVQRVKQSTMILAGSATNIVIAILFACVFVLVKSLGANSWICLTMATISQINLILAIFNLLPAPPLDGWALLCLLAPSCRRLHTEIGNGLLTAALVLVFCTFQFIIVLSNIGTRMLIHIIGICA